MTPQQYKVKNDIDRYCKTCRNRGRMCNKCWNFSIGRPSAAALLNVEAGLVNSVSNFGSVQSHEARSYRRILPKLSESFLRSNTPCSNSQTRSDSPLGDRQPVQNSTNTKQDDQDQNPALFSAITPRIHVLIPPMDELGKAVQFIVTQRMKSYSISHPELILFSDDRFVSRLALFKPRNAKFCLGAKRTATQLQNSQVMHWLLFLIYIIYRGLLDGNERIYKRHHISWVNRFEQQITSRMTAIMRPVTPADSRTQLTGHIEVSLLKHEVTETIAESYGCLQSSSLSFLQLAFSEPALWIGENATMSIALVRAVSSTRGEINRFACTDVMAALALGLPTLAAYNTSLDGLNTPSFHAMEYVHGCPTEFLITLVEIHNWRLQHPNDILPDETDTKSADSAQAVIRLAVRESWRHAALIYLYLAMCGARSDDPRIQSSVRQVIKLIDDIRPDNSYTTFFFLQYLFAGICAQKEQHRHCIMSWFLAPIHLNWGLLRVTEFAKVLDHLWHGAATNGRGVTWKDYIHSRTTVIPIHL
ncbi:unnamed protein product [Rhizoctonia solani]|uniref:Fungal-specific transcription factor domain-containing protein n=1 Tax=Rhizoctonia solani TaxID=456999 RepID=A0A8H3C6P1_9AGAM|nr:unnamed protein product [Rhizoctonia solani]